MVNKYNFEIPVEVSYCIDESNLTIESIRDLKKIQKKYDVDLDFVIDEYEYKVDMEEESMDDNDDYMGMTKEEIFDLVITELWSEIMEALTVDIKLNELDEHDVEKVFKLTSKSFNDSNLQKYFKNKNIVIESMTMTNFDREKSKFYVEVITEKKLKSDEIEEIRKFIDGQCSDGWGEGFEQQDISRHLDEDERYVYIKTWNPNNEVKYIKKTVNE